MVSPSSSCARTSTRSSRSPTAASSCTAGGPRRRGALGASWIALQFGDHGGQSEPLYVIAMCFAGGLLGALWSLIPGVLRAFAHTNEIITSLLLNYVAGYVLTYLIFDSAS